ncbi:MAG: amidohydrolase family protein [Halolamina sp.]
MRCLETDGVYHPDEERVGPGTVCIEGEEVVGLFEEPPSDADEVEQFGGYVLPGLVDAHSHGPIRPGEGDQLGQMRQDPATQAVRATRNLKRDLRAGTTTIRLLGCEHRLDLRLSEAERADELAAPRILPCGGHLTPTNGHGHALTATDGVESIRQRIRELVAAGAHQIKYFATGGVSSSTGGLSQAPYTDAEAEAIVDEAHRQGVHVAAHAHGGAGARQAIEAGVDTIEHAGALSADLIDRLDASGSHAVGTFSILHEPDGIEGGDADNPAVMAKVAEAREREREVWETVLDRDIPVALGTDSMHGRLPTEVEHLVDLGASPERALRAVTTEAARAARVADEAGLVAEGRTADLVVVPEHPVENPATLDDAVAVFKNGKRVD